MKIKTICLWGLFILIASIGTIGVVATVVQGGAYVPLTGLLRINVFQVPVWALAAILLILHAVWTLGALRGLAFIVLAFATGLVFEILGVRYGTVFGGSYTYDAGATLVFMDIPLLIPLIWSGFIYGGYTIVSAYLLWLNKNKPDRRRRNLWSLLLVIALDGLVVLFIDLLMEPLQVIAGNWIWLTGGPYFGVPVGNFVGWFLVTVTATGLFRTFEYLFPQPGGRVTRSVPLIPVVGYGTMCLAMVAFSLVNRLLLLAAIGFLTMFPVSAVNIVLYTRWKKTRTQRDTST